MTTLGSSYGTAKAAVIDTLSARPGLGHVAISYDPPADPLQVTGPTGEGDAIWVVDAEGDFDNVVWGAPILWVDESYDLLVVIQSLPRDSDDRQQAKDLRVDQMLGEVLMAAAADPSWGVRSFDHFIATRGPWRRVGGPWPEGTGNYPARCELRLSCEARIRFEP